MSSVILYPLLLLLTVGAFTFGASPFVSFAGWLIGGGVCVSLLERYFARVRGAGSDPTPSKPSLYQIGIPLLVVGLSLCTLAAIPLTGLPLATSLFLLLTLLLLGERRVGVIVLVLVVWSVISLGIFGWLLQVPLPAGLLFAAEISL